MDGPRWWNNKLWQSTDVPVTGARHLPHQNCSASSKTFDDFQSPRIMLEADPSTSNTLPVFQPLRVRRRSAQCFSPPGNGLRNHAERSVQVLRHSWSPRSTVGAGRPADPSPSFFTTTPVVANSQMERFPAPLSVIRLLSAGPNSEPQNTAFRPLGSLRVSYRSKQLPVKTQSARQQLNHSQSAKKLCEQPAEYAASYTNSYGRLKNLQFLLPNGLTPNSLKSTDCQDIPRAATSSYIAERRANMHSGCQDPPLETPKTKRTGSMLTTAFVNTKLRQRTVESSESSPVMSPVTPQPCISSNYRKKLQCSRAEGQGMINTAPAVTAVPGLNALERPPPTDSETTGPVDIDALVRREQKSGRTARTSVHILTNKFEHYSADRQMTPECVSTSNQPSGGLTFAHETLGLSNNQSFQSPRTMPSYISSICTEGKLDQPHGMSQEVRAIDKPKVLLSQRKVTEELEEVINLPAKPPQTILRPEGTSTEAFVDRAETPKPEIKVSGTLPNESRKNKQKETAPPVVDVLVKPQLRQTPTVSMRSAQTIYETPRIRRGDETPLQRSVEPSPSLLPRKIATEALEQSRPLDPPERPKSILKKVSTVSGQESDRGAATSTTRWLAYLAQREVEVSAAARAVRAGCSLKSPSAGLHSHYCSSALEISSSLERSAVVPERLRRDRRGVRFDACSNSELEFNIYEASYMLDRKMARSAISRTSERKLSYCTISHAQPIFSSSSSSSSSSTSSSLSSDNEDCV